MAQRPLNRCMHCNRTWYPRGDDYSPQCPACGVEFNAWDEVGNEVQGRYEAPTRGGYARPARATGSSALIAVAVAVCGFVGLGVACAVILTGGDKPREVAKAPEAPPAEKREVKEPPKPEPKPEIKPKPKPEPKPEPEPVVLPPEPPSIAVAPEPRHVTNRQPEGFATEWVQEGGVRTRVVGVSVTRPVLVSAKGQEFVGRDPVLLIWVETQSVTSTKAEVRRWINPLEAFAGLSGPPGVAIPPVRFSGATVAGQLERGVKLTPGGPGVVDVLVFAVPGPKAQTLTLRLLASHVGDSGIFEHSIPLEAWKK